MDQADNTTAQTVPNLSPSEQRNRQLARSTIVVIIAFAVAKLVSLAQTFIIARTFGVGQAWDTFVAANSIPEQIYTLIAGGALAYAFIPIFGGFLARGDTEGAWHIASRVINTVFLTMLALSIVIFLAAPWLVASIVAPGFTPDARAQTVELMRILLVSTLIFSVSGICMGILQSHNHFLLPAIAPILYDVGILFGVLFLVKPFGVHGIALGAVLGAAMHFAIQVPGLIRFRAHWWRELGWKDPTLWRVIRLMLPRVAGLGVFSLNFLVMYNLASRLGTGSVSAFSWGWRLMQIPETLIGTAMGIVIFPTMAALSELGDEQGKRSAMSGALRFVLIATIPSAVGLIFVGRPLISLLEGGAFDASASNLVYSVLRFFALGLIVHASLEVIARSFYADKDTYTPLWAALGGALINLVMSLVLSGVLQIPATTLFFNTLSLYPQLTVGSVGGLALANSLGVAFEVCVLLWLLRRRWHGAEENALVRTVLKTLVASLVMALAIVIVGSLWQSLGLAGQSLPRKVLQLGVETLVGMLVFLGVAVVLRLDELRMLSRLMLRRGKAAIAQAEQGA